MKQVQYALGTYCTLKFFFFMPVANFIVGPCYINVIHHNLCILMPSN